MIGVVVGWLDYHSQRFRYISATLINATCTLSCTYFVQYTSRDIAMEKKRNELCWCNPISHNASSIHLGHVR